VEEEHPYTQPQGKTPEQIAAMQKEGRLRAEIRREAFRWSIVNSVRRNCRSLVSFAKRCVKEIQRTDALEDLAMQVYEETDKAKVFDLLDKAAYRGRWNIYSELDEMFHEAIMEQEARRIKRDALREKAVEVVRDRFPTLVRLARKYVERLALDEVLEHVINQLSEAPDMATVRQILDIEGDKRRQMKLIVELVQHRFPGLVRYTEQQAEQIRSLHYLYCLRNFLTRASDEDDATRKIDLVASFDKKE
jgi:hypothetical protein